MKFDLDLSLGNIISLAMFLITLYSLHKSNTKRLDSMEAKFDILYKWFCEHIINKDESSSRRYFKD